MWLDVLTKPKQGMGFCGDRAMLMNCPEEYDNKVEQLWTHLQVLPKPKGPVDPSTVTKTISAPSKPGNDRRSVLAVGTAVDAEPAVMAVEREPAVNCVPGDERRRRVTWNLPDGRSDMRDSKLRKRHMELVIARAIRGRSTQVNLQIKKTPENSFVLNSGD